MELVARHDAATLIPIIQRHIQPGTRIWSDETGAYNNLNGLGYVHETVNHSQQFVNPISGCHTNNIESRWSACKFSFRHHSNVQRHMLPSYIDEYRYMWRCRHPMHNTFADIGPKHFRSFCSRKFQLVYNFWRMSILIDIRPYLQNWTQLQELPVPTHTRGSCSCNLFKVKGGRLR